jgi:hypothetical protein
LAATARRCGVGVAVAGASSCASHGSGICHRCDILGFAWRCPVFTPLGRMPSPSGGVVVGRRSEDLLEPTLLLTHQEGAAVARLLRVVAAAAAAPNADFRKMFGLCLAVPGFYLRFLLTAELLLIRLVLSALPWRTRGPAATARRCGVCGLAVLRVAWLRNLPSLRHFGLCLAVPGFHTIGTDAKPKRWCRRWAPVRGPAGTHTIADPPGGCCCRPTVASRCCGCGCSEC